MNLTVWRLGEAEKLMKMQINCRFSEKLTDLIGSRMKLERELPHLNYAIIYFKGLPFQLAADFLISLSNKVPTFEVEHCEVRW